MTTERKFYKTTYIVEVLSEEPIEDVDAYVGLQTLADITYEGPCVGRLHLTKEETITAKAMATELATFGSDSEFFMLNEDGTNNDEYWDDDDDNINEEERFELITDTCNNCPTSKTCTTSKLYLEGENNLEDCKIIAKAIADRISENNKNES